VPAHHRLTAAFAELATATDPRLRIRAAATDADWSAGEGLNVTGPIEALVLTLAGRCTALDQLQGDGTATVHMRAAALSRQ
jgi:hypothetical protein